MFANMTIYLQIKRGWIMGIFYKFGRFWAVLCPVALLVLTFKYAHQLNSILNQIEGMSFKKSLAILFLVFFALWSLLHLSSVLFVRVISWVWKGNKPSPTTKPSFSTQKKFEEPFKNNLEHHSAKEQENLFKLDLQSEQVNSLANEK